MCLSPVRLSTGVLVACRKCWQCRLVRVDDLVGRCIAESVNCKTHVVTLTYGEDEAGNKMHAGAAVLRVRDVQNFIKKLRFAGYGVRYMIAGEYGAQRRRAHWHCVLMWQDKVPPLPEFEKRRRWTHCDPKTGEVFEDWWPHGVVYFEEPAFEKLRYNLKYALKSTKDERAENVLCYSKHPPLGSQWFEERGRRIAEQGLVPLDGIYEFADIRRKDGIPRRFQMRGKTLWLFMTAYVRRWRELYGNRHFPPSSYFEKWEDAEGRSRGNYAKPSDKAVDAFGIRTNFEKVSGWVSAFQPVSGAKEWLEKPIGRVARLQGEPIEWDRPRETYAQFRMRQLREDAISKGGFSFRDRNRSVKR